MNFGSVTASLVGIGGKMKKLFGIMTAVLLVLFIVNPVSAAGAITDAERGIVDALSAAGAPVHRIAETETFLKQYSISDADAAKIVTYIKEAKGILDASGVDFTGVKSVDAAFKLLPEKTVTALKDIANAAAKLADVTIAFTSRGVFVTKNGTPVTGSGSTVKQTGSANIASIVVLAAVLIVASGAVVVSGKQRKT